MKKIIVEILESELKKLSYARVINVEEPHRLRGFFDGYTDFNEIHEEGREDIMRCAEQAIEEDAYGITVDIESGRDCRDHRCYTFIGASVIDSKEQNEYPDHKVSEMKKYLKESEKCQ